MSLSRSFRWPWSLNLRMFCVSIALMAIAIGISSFAGKPRAWPVAEVPIAFWAWRNQTPTDADVRDAIDKANARTIFLRAGQIDFQSEKLCRIRPVKGALPKGIDLHLVYNATRSLLAQLEIVDENALAETISAAYQVDTERAAQENAHVVGLQIDIDVPTRLLGRYGKALRALRTRLKPGAQLSITGLPTWMNSAELSAPLAQVDFWVPQLYGAEIPERSDQLIPISSPETVSLFVNRARALNKPFYAGLAAYGCALLYSPNGSLISLRGDLDPAAIASDPNLDLIDQRPFAVSAEFNSAAGGAAKNTEWRYGYRARADGVTDGLAMHAGDVLVMEVPSADSLRASARIVRELAGKELLGICVFRLPASDDPATLTAAQVASALSDRDSAFAMEVRLKPEVRLARTWILELKNVGIASAIVGGAKIDISLPAGEVQGVTAPGSTAVETLCASADENTLAIPQPCSERRANLIRFKPRVLISDRTIRAQFVLRGDPPARIPVSIQVETDSGQTYSARQEITVEKAKP
jgi:hypothetical protein